MTPHTFRRLFQSMSWCIACLLALGAAAPAAAADTDYQLLVVACDQQHCRRIAEQRMASRAGQKASYSERNMKVEIETLSARMDEADANVKVEVGHRNSDSLVDAKRTTLMLPCRVSSKALTSLATFVADGTIYHVWAKMLPASVAAALR